MREPYPSMIDRASVARDDATILGLIEGKESP